MTKSKLQRERLKFEPHSPKTLGGNRYSLIEDNKAYPPSECDQFFPNLSKLKPVTITPSTTNTPEPQKPMRVGVLLSGGPAPGGHNVIAGLFAYLKSKNPQNQLIGFIGGPIGLITGKYIEITAEVVAPYKNQGGFDIITTGRDKIETAEQFQRTEDVVKNLQLDGIVIIGGDDSNTNAALLAEYFISKNVSTKVIGCPKTIDGDLKNDSIEVSFGFDTASKTYSELIGNVMSDVKSTKKYYHFIRLMGRSASHITLECALQTCPNITLIGEEIFEEKKTMIQIITEIVDIIVERANNGFNFGVILVPEGLIEFIPEFSILISELNDILAQVSPDNFEKILSSLSSKSVELFQLLPTEFRNQLLLDRDPHGNIPVSQIETEKLLISIIKSQLKQLKQKGVYKGNFAPLTHFFGYEGRCALPSNFDCNYCNALGKTAGILLEHNITGMMAVVNNLSSPTSNWKPGGYPFHLMMNAEKRKGKMKPVIRKALVNLDDVPFRTFKQHQKEWALGTYYHSPGPIQFYGNTADDINVTLMLEHNHSYPNVISAEQTEVKLVAKRKKMHLMYYFDSEGKRVYTLKKFSPEGKPTLSAHPARFSPDDKFSKHRVTLKKRFGILLTQQPERAL